jgi:hypothetical protein
MTCCIFGVLLTAAFLGLRSLIRQRILGRPKSADPTTWHLEMHD